MVCFFFCFLRFVCFFFKSLSLFNKEKRNEETMEFRRASKKENLILGGIVLAIIVGIVLASTNWRSVSVRFKKPVYWSSVFTNSHSNSSVGAVYSSSNSIDNPAFKAFDGKEDTYWRPKKDYDLFDSQTGMYIPGSMQQDERISKQGAGLRFHSSLKSFDVEGYEILSPNILSWSFMKGSEVIDTRMSANPLGEKPKRIFLKKRVTGNDFRLVIHSIVPGTGTARVNEFKLFHF